MNVLTLLDEIDMLPCPFCGHEEPRVDNQRNDCNLGYFVQCYCPHCGANLMNTDARKTSMEAKTDAIRKWNKREFSMAEDYAPNPRLIRAAPDLYAALRNIVDAARDFRARLSDEEQIGLSRLIEESEKALEKAGGGK